MNKIKIKKNNGFIFKLNKSEDLFMKKTKILECWYSIDEMLFGKPASEVITEQNDFDEYISMKGTLLSNAFEMWNHFGYEPKFEEDPKNTEQLKECAKQQSKHSIKLTENLMRKDTIKESISNRVMKESKQPKEKEIRQKVRECYHQMNIDNVILGIPMFESNVKEHDMRGAILEEAHTLIRDSLMDIVKKYVN